MAKNLVLLSDGTGQRGGVGYATNVWLLNEALPRGDQQLVCYDDGVGSEKMLIPRALGGAVGLGLSRNVRNLYRFLVRNWQSSDQIYLFGFSRGAFTVRSLAGLIAKCGIANIDKFHSEQELDRAIKAAYSAYRTNQFFPGVAEQFKQQFGVFNSATNSKEIPIQFLGVWDTVDAVGVPFDELRDAFDDILRYSFRDYVLDSSVACGRQALAIDEARRTFLPMLWDERLEVTNRIKQVWFAGVHSNVGGGYPKRQLAMIPLVWMMHEAEAQGLVIEQTKLTEYDRQKDTFGRLYDSRAGISAYYRYGPRFIDELTQQYTHAEALIHESVVQRIEYAFDDYSPSNLPQSSTLVGKASGNFTVPDESRKDINIARGIVWWKRVLLGFLWIVTLVVLALPWMGFSEPPASASMTTAAEGALKLADTFLPDFADKWLDALQNHPWFVAIVALALLSIGFLRYLIGKHATEFANAGWSRKFPDHRTSSRPTHHSLFAEKLSALAHKAQGWTVRESIFELLSALVIGFLSLCFFLPLKFGQWIHKHWSLRGEGFENVRKAQYPKELAPGEKRALHFTPHDYKCLTGILVKKDQTHTIRVKSYAGWKDGRYDATPNGLKSGPEADRLNQLAFLLKRHPSEPLMKLMVRVQCRPLFFIRTASTTKAIGTQGELTPAKDGELTFYVNDAMPINIPILRGLLFGFREMFYRNNRGVAVIEIFREPIESSRHESTEKKQDIPGITR